LAPVWSAAFSANASVAAAMWQPDYYNYPRASV
jgi:hypothetical protein